MISLGIDLTAKPENPNGIAVLQDGELIDLKIVKNDPEILAEVRRHNPKVIAIDAPLSFPESGLFRSSDLALKDMGARPLPPTLASMKPLVVRVKRLIELFASYQVIEVFPRATEKILKLNKFQVEKQYKRTRISEDEYDAILCAITGKLFLEGKAKTLGNLENEYDQIVVPIG